MEQTIKHIPPTGGGAEAVATNDAAYSVGDCGSTALDGPLEEDFLRAIIQSACKSTLQQQLNKFAFT
jgi:hypothetical protein